jgi:hypothetical protein
MQNGCCKQSNKDPVVNSRNFCIDASPHEWLASAAQQNHMANARYRTTRADISACSPIVTKYTVHVIVTLTWMPRQPRISSLSATSSQALETSPETIFARYLHADTTTTTGFSRLSRSSMLASSTVACQKNLVTRLSAPEASIMLSIIPLPRRPSLGNKRFFTSGINPSRKSRDR